MHLHHLTMWQLELLPWYAFVLVWVVAALWAKSAKVEEPISSRLAYGSLMAAGFYLLFSRGLHFGILSSRFVATEQWIQIAGIALTWAGVGLAIWARFILGDNWSAKVTRKVGHELVRTGPYSVVRHPIYTGLTLSTMGTALFVGEWRGVVAVVLVLASESIKARREEKFMVEEFGETYQQYRKETWFIVPGF